MSESNISHTERGRKDTENQLSQGTGPHQHGRTARLSTGALLQNNRFRSAILYGNQKG